MKPATGNNMATLIPPWATAAPSCTCTHDATPSLCHIGIYDAIYRESLIKTGSVVPGSPQWSERLSQYLGDELRDGGPPPLNEKGVHAIREEIASIIEKVVKDYPTETMLIQHLKWASQAANRATTDGMLRCLVELSRARALMGCPADDGVNIRVQIEDVLRMDYLWIFVATHGVRAFLIDKQLASPIDEAAGSDK